MRLTGSRSFGDGPAGVGDRSVAVLRRANRTVPVGLAAGTPDCICRCNPGTIRGMSTSTVGFAVADEDQERLARLVEHFGGGNRSADLRATLPVIEALAGAERLGGRGAGT